MFSLSMVKRRVLHTNRIIGSMLLLLGSATSVADTPQQGNSPTVKPVESPSADASLFNLGWNYYVDTKHPAKASFEADVDVLDGLDLCKLRLGFFDRVKQRYEVVATVRPNRQGGFEVPIEREGIYSLLALPPLPASVDAVRQLCTLPDRLEIALEKPLLEDFCPKVYCPAFKKAGLPKPFDAETVCKRCYGLHGRAPRDIAECGLLPYDEKSESSPAGFDGIRTIQYKCDGNIAIAKFPRRIPNGARLPLVLYVHGDTGYSSAYRNFNYVLERLAINGFLAASIDTSAADFLDDMLSTEQSYLSEVRFRVDKLKKHLDCWRDGEIQIVQGGDFRDQLVQHVDLNNIGLAGLSQGGEAIVLAFEKNRDESWGYGIRAIHAIAPSDQSNSVVDGVPYLMLVGGADDDNDNGRDGLRVYDRATATAPKIQAFVYGADHSSFSGIHREVEGTLAVSFFRHFLQGYQPARDLWTGQAQVASLQAFQMFWSYQDPFYLMVDTFEPTANGLNPFRNDLDGQNESVPGRGPPNPNTGQRSSFHLFPLEEVWLGDRRDPLRPDDRFYHPTHGLKLGWDNPEWTSSSVVLPTDRHGLPTPQFVVNIPPNHRNSAGRKPFLSFRVAQYFDESTNTHGQAQDFEVGLEDETGTRGYLKVSDYAEIPWPFERNDNRTKSVLQTVRLPLCAFSPENAPHKIDLDVTRIAKVLFRFNQRRRGLIALDGIQFTE